jgi:nitrogen fixation/metabolism regulation signal transduction histidine kinase
MNIFFAGILIVCALLLLIGWLLWRKTRRGSKFQARLTILFFLFVIIPIVPLTITASYVLTKSSQMLTFPGIEQALSTSIELIHLQLEQRALAFLDRHNDLDSLSTSQLLAEGCSYAGKIRIKNGEQQLVFYSTSPDFAAKSARSFSLDEVELILHEQHTSSFVPWETNQVYEHYQVVGPESFIFVAFELPAAISKARQSVSFALRNYSSLQLLRDSIVDRGLIWLVVFVIIILFAFLAMYTAEMLSQGISRPIHSLAQAMREIGAGDLDVRVNVKAKDEVGFLIDSFNRMADELKIGRENLQRMERLAAWRDVARQISHEIKNPLTPIQLSLSRLRMSLPAGLSENHDLKESLRIIEEEIGSLKNMAKEFSEFARMPQPKKKDEDIAAIIRDCARLFETELAHYAFSMYVEPDIPLIPLDKEQIKRVLQNIIKNAIQATPPGQAIKITTSYVAESETVEIDIEDHGQGMDEETCKRIFEPYYTTKKDGTGLGLFIVQKIITDHGGLISVESEEGKGTVMRIRLKRSR